MKKSLSKAIALATLLGATASAQAAISVNPDGLGEVLLYSLYTAEEGNITNINITNTSNQAKAVKVRFVEGQNSQEVLDFNLYLSPRDQWSGAVTATATGAQLISNDKSCTVPAVTLAGVPFRDLDYIGDGGNQTLARGRVGHLEVIEMGTFTNDVTGRTLARALQAGSEPGQAPASCGTIRNAFGTDGAWTNIGIDAGLGVEGDGKFAYLKSGQDDVEIVNGGLYGTAEVMNVAESTVISYDAVALEGFLSGEDGSVASGAPLHATTGSIYPSLNGNIKPPVFVANVYDPVENATTTSKDALIDGVTYTFPNTVQAISAVLAASDVSNNYVIDEGRASVSNWVLTFPTKRFHVDPLMDHGLAWAAWRPWVTGITRANRIAAAVPAAKPFENLWNIQKPGQACEDITINAWDNEEYIEADVDFSPSRADQGPALCYETNIVTFNGGKLLGGEFVSENIELDAASFPYGWMNVDFSRHLSAIATVSTGEDDLIVGLPVIGFSAANFRNYDPAATAGFNNIYTSSSNHKANKDTEKSL